MSAEQYGARLLGEVQEESLDAFLAELKHAVCPQPRSVLGLPQLDALLEAVRYPVSITPQRPAWHSPAAESPVVEDARSVDDDDFGGHGSPERHGLRVQEPKATPATIELTSTNSASGKTSLLLYLTALSGLPTSLGGKASAVVCIDADGRFSAARLAQIIRHYIKAQQQSISNPSDLSEIQLEATIKESLDHIHVYRPHSSSQVIEILANLSDFLFDRTRHQSIHRPLGLIILDSATAFHWQDRFDRAAARLETPGMNVHTASTSPTTQIIDSLKSLQEQFECAVLFSTTSSTQPSKQHRDAHPTTPSDNSPGISPWTAYATVTLNLSRVPVPQFAPQMSMEECLRDREKRFEAVRKGRFVASVLDQRQQAAGDRMDRERILRFRSTEEGFAID